MYRPTLNLGKDQQEMTGTLTHLLHKIPISPSTLSFYTCYFIFYWWLNLIEKYQPPQFLEHFFYKVMIITRTS